MAVDDAARERADEFTEAPGRFEITFDRRWGQESSFELRPVGEYDSLRAA
jgi:hypothetical protein